MGGTETGAVDSISYISLRSWTSRVAINIYNGRHNLVIDARKPECGGHVLHSGFFVY
jgi:hypothetical protein